MSTLEVDIAKVRLDLIAKDDELRELTQQASSDDKEASAEASAEVKKVKVEKNVLQAQLECKSRQLKVSIALVPTAYISLHTPYNIRLLWGCSMSCRLSLYQIVIMLLNYKRPCNAYMFFCMHVGILPDMFTSTVSKCSLASML